MLLVMMATTSFFGNATRDDGNHKLLFAMPAAGSGMEVSAAASAYGKALYVCHGWQRFDAVKPATV